MCRHVFKTVLCEQIFDSLIARQVLPYHQSAIAVPAPTIPHWVMTARAAPKDENCAPNDRPVGYANQLPQQIESLILIKHSPAVVLSGTNSFVFLGAPKKRMQGGDFRRTETW
jgi:hypothetical protein